MSDSNPPLLNRPGLRRFGRFLIVGAVNSGVGYGLYAAFVLLGLMPEVALLVATILGVAFNFITTGRLVFGRRDYSRALRFVGVYAAMYVINAMFLRSFRYLGVDPLVAQLLLLPSFAVATFLALRGFVFKEKVL